MGSVKGHNTFFLQAMEGRWLNFTSSFVLGRQRRIKWWKKKMRKRLEIVHEMF
jgi:hypothetical protein